MYLLKKFLLRFKQVEYFLFFYRGIGPSVFVLFLLSIVSTILDGFGLAMIIPLIQSASSLEEAADPSGNSLGALSFLFKIFDFLGVPFNFSYIIMVIIVLFLSKGFFKFYENYFKTKIRMNFLKTIRVKLVNYFSNMTYSGFLSLDGGRVQNIISVESHKLYSLFSSYFNTLQNAIILLVYITLAFVTNFQFAILVLISVLLSNFLFKFVYRLTKKYSINITQTNHAFQSYLIQIVHHFKYLKATGLNTTYAENITDKVKKVEQEHLKIGFLDAILVGFREPVVVIVTMMAIFIEVQLLGGSLEGIMVSLLFFYRSLTYLLSVQSSWQLFISNIGSLEAIDALMIELKNKQENAEFGILPTFQRLSLNNVSFGYANDTSVLKDVNLELEKNKTYAFVGDSGSGKTTLVNLIAGLLSPKTGEMLFNDVIINRTNISSYRANIGYITQEPVIFNDSLYNNVSFWTPKTPENLVRFKKAVSLASLDMVIENLDNKEDTVLGDNGFVLSGGQRQRVSIAREIFKGNDLLFLDEATSALDSETELVIKENLKNLFGKVTIVIVAHRLSTIIDVDKVFLIESGKILDSGSFSELYLKSEKFKSSVELQGISI